MTTFLLTLAAADPQAATPTPVPRRLDLGPYGAPAGGRPQVESITDTPRFESTIDVEGKAPADFNLTMAVWWAHFNLPKGGVYGRGTAFRQAPPQGSVDVTPLVGWVADKVRDFKRNRQATKDEATSDAQSDPKPTPTPTPEP